MPVGYWFMFVALFSFAAMGIIHKLGDRYACNAAHCVVHHGDFVCVQHDLRRDVAAGIARVLEDSRFR